MALLFLVFLSLRPHLHDKQRHFEAACVITGYLSLISDLLILTHIFFFFAREIHFLSHALITVTSE